LKRKQNSSADYIQTAQLPPIAKAQLRVQYIFLNGSLFCEPWAPTPEGFLLTALSYQPRGEPALPGLNTIFQLHYTIK
jgi:hypothetical protein